MLNSTDDSHNIVQVRCQPVVERCFQLAHTVEMVGVKNKIMKDQRATVYQRYTIITSMLVAEKD